MKMPAKIESGCDDTSNHAKVPTPFVHVQQDRDLESSVNTQSLSIRVSATCFDSMQSIQLEDAFSAKYPNY